MSIPSQNLLLPAQMDEKTHWPDGSVRTAVLTFDIPAIPLHSAPIGIMIQHAAKSTKAPEPIAFPLGAATVKITTATATYTIDVHDLTNAATHTSYWLSGPLVTEARYDVALENALHVVLDVRSYTDGTSQIDTTFANDLALANGVAESYTADIALGAASLHQTISAQQPFTNWHQVLYSTGAAPAGNLVHDISALETTGLIPQYPLTLGVQRSTILMEKAAASCGPLGACGMMAYMPTTGARPDIGLLPRWDNIWLETQDAAAAQYAMAQADAAGSVPWHNAYFPAGRVTDPPAQTITLSRYPNWWSDDRCPNDYFLGPCSLMSYTAAAKNSGITPDAAHMPALAYVAYLMTGSHHYLDEVAAEAGWSELVTWPVIRRWGTGNTLYGVTNTSSDIVINPLQQLRGGAWSLREIMMASLIEPDGSNLQAYFSAQAAHNLAFAATLAAVPAKGELVGFVDGEYSDDDTGLIAPWENDYLALVAEWAIHAGLPSADTLVAAMAPFLVDRFIQPNAVFSPFDGGAYQLSVGSGTFGSRGDVFKGFTYLTTWSQVENATLLNGTSNSKACLPPVNRKTCFWLGVVGAAAQSAVLGLPASARAALPGNSWRQAVNWIAANPGYDNSSARANLSDPLFLNWEINP